MKARKLLSLLAIAALVMGLVACKDKKSSSSNNNVTPTPAPQATESYFSIEGAAYVEESFPQSTSEVEIIAAMNPAAIPGSANLVEVTSPVAAEKILVGVGGSNGYYEVQPHQVGSDKEIIYDFVMINSQLLSDNEFTVVVAVLDENGEVTQTFETTMHLVVVGTGRLQVALAFDTDKDLDLHLIEPNGERIFYGNSMSDNGGELDLDSNAACDIDGVNHENIYYGDNAVVEPGEYTVYVDMWRNCDESVPTNFVLSVFYEGELIQTVEGVNPIAGYFPADEPSNSGYINNIQPVCHFIIPDNGPAKSEPAPQTGNRPKFWRSANK